MPFCKPTRWTRWLLAILTNTEKIMTNLDRLSADVTAQGQTINNVLVPQIQKNSTDIQTAIGLIKAGNPDAALGVLADAVEANNAALQTAATGLAADDSSLETAEAPPAQPGA